MKRALIIEDDPVWSNLIGGYCKAADFEPLVVQSPQEAIDQLDERRFDVIILDMLLATETGMALLNELRSYEDLNQIPVIVCTNIKLSHDQLKPYGVVELFDKSLMTPTDMAVALRGITA